MSFKFNRGCWVESTENGWNVLATGCGETPEDGTIEGASVGSRSLRTMEGRIVLARLLMDKFGRRLLAEKTIQILMSRLNKGISVSHEAMRDLGVSGACALCDEKEPEGSCCSTGLENKIETPLLLINLLLGVKIQRTGQRKGSCFFLSRHGCTLKARHMLCIDYLCPPLERQLGAKNLVRMQMATEEEIQSLFLLEEEIGARISLWLRAP